MNENKIYVDVNATFTKDGMLLPKSFVWEDGVEYEISKVKDIRRAASLKAGGAGMRYTCVVDGKEVYLFYEDNNIACHGQQALRSAMSERQDRAHRNFRL
mgnify:CR=1 FL=1